MIMGRRIKAQATGDKRLMITEFGFFGILLLAMKIYTTHTPRFLCASCSVLCRSPFFRLSFSPREMPTMHIWHHQTVTDVASKWQRLQNLQQGTPFLPIHVPRQASPSPTFLTFPTSSLITRSIKQADIYHRSRKSNHDLVTLLSSSLLPSLIIMVMSSVFGLDI